MTVNDTSAPATITVDLEEIRRAVCEAIELEFRYDDSAPMSAADDVADRVLHLLVAHVRANTQSDDT